MKPSAALPVLAGSVFVFIALTRPLPAAERWSRDVGVIDYYAKYTRKAPDRSGKAAVTACFNAVKAIGMQPELVDVDIFLDAHRQKREQYRRIVIPPTADWFSPTMYQGMDEYVLSGGLLITNVSLILQDANDNYMIDQSDGISDFAQKHFLGVRGHASCYVTRLKILHDCPLTAGLPSDIWLDLTSRLGSRRTSNVGAYVVVNARGTYREQAVEQPFLTFKHSGRGACIYLAGALAAKAGKNYARITENLFSDQVLEWLCLQE